MMPEKIRDKKRASAGLGILSGLLFITAAEPVVTLYPFCTGFYEDVSGVIVAVGVKPWSPFSKFIKCVCILDSCAWTSAS
jgi:hypothetical protein